jgi:hypothetical protein
MRIDLRMVVIAVAALGGGASAAPRGAAAKKKAACASVSAVFGAPQGTYAVVDGHVKAWGQNDAGVLGAGEQDKLVSEPTDVPGLDGATAILSWNGALACALTGGGAVKCWGLDDKGQVGNGKKAGPDSRVLAPAATPITAGATQLAVTTNSACALVKGGVKCWGAWYGHDGGSSVTPIDIKGATAGVTAISGGGTRQCALVKGALKCWGNADNDSAIAAPKDLPTGLTGVAVGTDFICVLTGAGGVKCWGSAAGRDADGNNTKKPVDVPGLAKGVASIHAALGYACAILATGGATCWGDYDPLAAQDPKPTAAPFTHVAQLALGAYHVCALSDAGTVQCLGSNTYGQLGGTPASEHAPVDVCLK